MMACGAQMLLCLIALAVLPPDWLLPVVTAQEPLEDSTELESNQSVHRKSPSASSRVSNIKLPINSKDDFAAPDPGEKVADGQENDHTAAPECHEEQFPCTRLYSVHKPVKQCISYLCVTSVRRTYMINKEICSRIVCKEDEAMQDEICRQLAGLPPRRLRRSGQPQRPLCRQAKDQQRNIIDPQ